MVVALFNEEPSPFDPPKSGKIAIKVIKHGDQVLKVYTVST